MDNIYKLAWIRGLKTTYYLRSMGATAAEKTSVEGPLSSQDINRVAPEVANPIIDNYDLMSLNKNIKVPTTSKFESDCEVCQ